jgi:hypothetical protein
LFELIKLRKRIRLFRKGFRRFVDRSVDGKVREFDRHGFGFIGEIQVQLLNQRLDWWKNLVFNAVEFALYVIFNLRTL